MNILIHNILLSILFIIGLAYAASDPPAKTDEEKQEEADLKVLVDDAMDWAHKVGMIWRPKESKTKSDIAMVIPVALFPTPFPRTMFEEAYALQTTMNLLYYRAARDYEFLVDVMTEPAKSDPTIGVWLDVLKQMKEEGITQRQPITMFYQRSDYMAHTIPSESKDGKPEFKLKQIEVNNGAPAGLIGERVTMFHERMLLLTGNEDPSKVLPENPVTSTIAQGLYVAWQKFGNPKAVLLMVTTPNGNQHQFEKRYIEYELEKMSKGKMRTVYLSIGQLQHRLRLADDNTLMLGGLVVGVVFFRASYVLPPLSLAKNDSLNTRIMIERSTAIKCPSVSMILTSAKKFQQIMAKPGNVERFFPDPKDAPKIAAIRKTFAGLWGIEDESEKTQAVIKDAIANPDRYVLKPNREGGGHNIWGQDISDKLSTLPAEDRHQFILMEKLSPYASYNYFVRNQKPAEYGPVTSELSVFGVLVADESDPEKETILHNGYGGHLYRTKWANVNEGGITPGTGVYDSPYLF